MRPGRARAAEWQPYKIHLINGSDDTHTFSAAGFFKAIVLRKVVVNGAEKPNLSDDGATLDEHQQADLNFVRKAKRPSISAWGVFAWLCVWRRLVAGVGFEPTTFRL